MLLEKEFDCDRIGFIRSDPTNFLQLDAMNDIDFVWCKWLLAKVDNISSISRISEINWSFTIPFLRLMMPRRFASYSVLSARKFPIFISNSSAAEMRSLISLRCVFIWVESRLSSCEQDAITRPSNSFIWLWTFCLDISKLFSNSTNSFNKFWAQLTIRSGFTSWASLCLRYLTASFNSLTSFFICSFSEVLLPCRFIVCFTLSSCSKASKRFMVVSKLFFRVSSRFTVESRYLLKVEGTSSNDWYLSNFLYRNSDECFPEGFFVKDHAASTRHEQIMKIVDKAFIFSLYKLYLADI